VRGEVVAEEKPENPVVLLKGQQADEEWEAFKARVVSQFREAGLLKEEKE